MRARRHVRHAGVKRQTAHSGNAFLVLFLATLSLGQTVKAANWRFVLTAPASGQETLTVGMDEAATNDFDEGLDEETPVPPPFALGSLYAARFDNGVLDITLSKDIRSISETARWSVTGMAPADADLTVSWDTALHSLPADGLLSLVETTAQGEVLSDGERVVIQGKGQTSVPAGATRYFELKYITGPYSIVDLKAGWNLISLPLDPVSHDPEVVFADLGSRQNADRTTKAPFTMTAKNSGPAPAVWSWHPLTTSYHPAKIVVALHPYWIYASVDMQTAIPGSGLAPLESYPLRRGWNLFGVSQTTHLPANPLIRGQAWYWNASTQNLKLTDTLVPGMVYWVNCATTTAIAAY